MRAHPHPTAENFRCAILIAGMECFNKHSVFREFCFFESSDKEFRRHSDNLDNHRLLEIMSSVANKGQTTDPVEDKLPPNLYTDHQLSSQHMFLEGGTKKRFKTKQDAPRQTIKCSAKALLPISNIMGLNVW